MQIFHLYHQRQLYKLAHSKFWQLEFAIWLHIFARTLISIFIPILLLQIGYSIGQIMLYYFLLTITDVPLNFLARWLITKIGARMVMMLSTLAAILFFTGLYLLESTNWPLLLTIIFLGALYDAFYFVSHIYLFIKSETEIPVSRKSTSWLYIVKMFAALVGPIIGGVILIFSSRHVLILASVFFFAISILPLLHLKNLPDKPTRIQPSFKKFFQQKTDRRNFLSHAFFSIHRNVEIILWPLFIYLIFTTIESVAYVPVIISLTTIVFSYWVGQTQKYRKETLIVIGSLLIGFVWLIRLTSATSYVYYLSIFLISFFALLVTIPLDSDIFERGLKASALNTATYRNAASMGTQAILFGTLYLAVDVFQVGFVITILCLLVLLSINYLALRSTKPETS